MDIQKELADFKKRIDKELEIYLNKNIEESRKEDPFIGKLADDVKRFVLSGGKRIRAAMMYYGYLTAGGKDDEAIIRACMSVELIHAFLLVHDDIMDRDEIRHGEPTLHALYRDRAKMWYPKKDARLFGDSIAISLGDMLAASGSHVIFTSSFSSERIVRALEYLQKIVSQTVIGQIKDVRMGFDLGAVSEEEVLQMYEQKTARYTLEGPLALGAILAGRDDTYIQSFGPYALSVGIAYQIQDDILGIYGKQDTAGKTMGSDIEQGKATLLVARVFSHGNKEQKKRLRGFLGKQITKASLQEVKDIFEQSGALEYVRERNKTLLKEGARSLEYIECKNERAKDFLFSIVSFLSERRV